ncbi:MAG: DUF4136 domain-containing protein [Sphingomonadaceae bacterium]|nr:DUF4136 domain-containing protein [Sphingomonadaceae bacterium]
MTIRPALAAALLALGGCAASIPPVDVTRFHLGQDIARGAIAPAPEIAGNTSGLERATYDAAVSRELERIGFPPARDFTAARYTFTTEVTRDARERLARRSPVTIGIGGGSFGGGYSGGFGGGVGASFGIGGDRSRATVVTRLSVQIRERATGAVVWEGRAETAAPDRAPAAQPALAAEKLAAALFRDFPGESGRTISVP